MFDFLSSDWFNMALEVLFLFLMVYDIQHYIETKKREYILNIVLTIVFFLWAAIPFYHSYVTWSDENKKSFESHCLQENNQTLCSCLDDKVFKEFTFEEFTAKDKNSSDYKEFLKESKEECLDDSWF